MHVSRLDYGGSPPKSFDRPESLNTDLAHAVVPPLPLKDAATDVTVVTGDPSAMVQDVKVRIANSQMQTIQTLTTPLPTPVVRTDIVKANIAKVGQWGQRVQLANQNKQV